MSELQYFCCTDERRDAVKAHATLNGIDFLEVSADERSLQVHFLKDRKLDELAAAPAAAHFLIEGGQRVANVRATKVTQPSALVLAVEVSEPGDYSVYTLRLLDVNLDNDFDPVLSSVSFSFKISCPADFDCKAVNECPSERRQEPPIDYLAKDYASFRRLMLDRMAVLLPAWRERNPADPGIALVEMLAYVGDRLSYKQDAVATEAYLRTARQRTSVRRHARLVDYYVSDGSNARAWVQLQVSALVTLRLRDSTGNLHRHRLLTVCGDHRPVIEEARLAAMLREHAPEVFEPLLDPTPEGRQALDAAVDVDLLPQHNRIDFYTWGGKDCCLPAGSTSATLKDSGLELKKHDVLVFEEVLGPQTGAPQDADPGHRHAVRLTNVEQGTDPLFNQAIVRIEWSDVDALPFPLCISWTTDEDHGSKAIEGVSVARGNIVLADHGMSVLDEPLGMVPEPQVFLPPSRGVAGRCEPAERVAVSPRFRPRLAGAPVTQQPTVLATRTQADGRRLRLRVYFDPEAPAKSAFPSDVPSSNRLVIPRVSLKDSTAGEQWLPRRDLLGSASTAEDIVLEVENDLTAYLRFGDDVHGKRPASGTSFIAAYRVGNGAQGNVGAGAIHHLVTNQSDLASAVTAVRNPLPARGASDPESLEEVRKNAPVAFRRQERAVTPADYAVMTERQEDLAVQRSAARFRWTGSWRTVFVAADRTGGRPLDLAFKDTLRDRLERYRMAGHDLEVETPVYVSLEVAMSVCATADHFRNDVKQALLWVFSRNVLPDGHLGVFHPDNFTFGHPFCLSRLYEAAMGVEGVASVQISIFRRRGDKDTKALDSGVITFGPLEIGRLDNDPNFKENGIFKLEVFGGK